MNKKTIKKGCLNEDVFSCLNSLFSRHKLIKNYALASVQFVFFQKTNLLAKFKIYRLIILGFEFL
jgi:hypothetical protein